MKKEWFTLAELAAEKLPGMPDTEAGMRGYAERNGWVGRPAGRPAGHEWFTIEEIRRAWLDEINEMYLSDLLWAFAILSPDWAQWRAPHPDWARWQGPEEEFYISIFTPRQQADLRSMYLNSPSDPGSAP